ncbi:MAG: hypothetical protein HY814_15370 [Candidatus Riflebacteria bacterium]|nr:hypothetical protein [Candidatus Riflebacteria bacterium]
MATPPAAIGGLLEEGRVEVPFALEQSVSDPKMAVFVLGDLPELGGGDVRRAVKLEGSQTPRWRVTVRLPAGASYTYRYLLRDTTPQRLSHPCNGTFLGSEETGTVPKTSVTMHTRRVSVQAPSRYSRVAVLAPDGRERVLRPLAGAGKYLAATGLPFHKGDTLRFSGPEALRVPPVDVQTDAQQIYFSSELTRGEWGLPGKGELSPRRLELHQDFPSGALRNRRTLRVYLPRGYDTYPERRYPVLYVHDGQNVFAPGGTFGCWDMDRHLDRLIASGGIPELIVVGMDCNQWRLFEYVPPFTSAGERPKGVGHLYTRFVTEEVAPFVDRTYRTLPSREHRLIGGSSLGGLISAYMAWERPDFASRFLCFSTAFCGDEMRRKFRTEPPRNVSFYFDCGDQGESADGLADTYAARDALLEGGYYRLEANLFHTIGYGHRHHETAWSERFEPALRRLFCGAELAVADGDVNADGRVDAADLESLRELAARPGTAGSLVHARADLDGSGTVDARDVARACDR